MTDSMETCSEEMPMLSGATFRRTSYQSGRELNFDRGARTRSLSTIGMILAYIFGIAAISFSIYLFVDSPDEDFTNERTGTKSTSLATPSRFALDLTLNALVTICTEALGYIHSTSLRWSLWREERLAYSSNIRLFTTANSFPHKWYSNFAFCFALIITYAGASQVLVSQNWRGIWPRPFDGEGTEINGFALLILGIGLLIQAFIASYCLLRQNVIMTWSSNILAITSACVSAENGLSRRSGRCMLSSLDAANNVDGPAFPKQRQPSLRSTDRSVRHITRFLWTLPIMAAIWAIVTAIIGRHSVFLTEYSVSSHIYGFLLISGFQSVLTIGLHAAEVLVNRSRDEMLWRQAGYRLVEEPKLCHWKSAGAPSKNESVLAALKSWQSLCLFFLKPIAHWLFGNSISLSTDKFVTAKLSPFWPFGLSVAAFLIALIGSVLGNNHPKGTIPATWGHLQSLVDLIDDWGKEDAEKLFWGEKKYPSEAEIRHAGTSDSLDDVIEPNLGVLYA